MTIYKIKCEIYTYSYRSYMACEDQFEDDCVGYNFKYLIYSSNKLLKPVFRTRLEAQKYIRKLKRKDKK